jgi:uncharacterized protein
MSEDLSRRRFLKRLGVGTAAGASIPLLKSIAEAEPPRGSKLPHRVLGQTGAKVSILAFGCGSRLLMYGDEEKGGEAINRAIDLGITYIDTAYLYGNGKSETWVGKVMATRRKEVWLATKIPDRTRDEFMKRLEASLKRLQVDHVDLLHIHELGSEEDLAKIEAPDGALKGLLEARDQKMTRFIGMTCHGDGRILAKALERHDLNCTQFPLNGSQNGHFEEVALPAAKRKNMGVIAMKVVGQDFLIGDAPAKAHIDALLRYSLSLPVSAAVVGMPTLAMLEHNIAVARNFIPMTAAEMEGLRHELAPSRGGMEQRLHVHRDGLDDAHGTCLA